jgi:hypothetical protein
MGPKRGVESGDRVPYRDADPYGRAVGVADEVPEPAVRFGDGGKPRTLGQRAGLPEGGDARDDEFRVGLIEDLRAEAPFLQRARAEVFQQDVRLRGELQDRLPARLGPQVQHHGLLVAVDRPVEHGGVTLVQPPVAQLVAGSRPLHFDDLGAEVGEQPSGRRRGNVVSEFQDADAFQGRDAWWCHGVFFFRGRTPGTHGGLRFD